MPPSQGQPLCKNSWARRPHFVALRLVEREEISRHLSLVSGGTRSRRLNAQQSCNEAVTPVKKSRLAGIADWARAVSLFGGGTHGNCDYNLEIHVPQAFAADVLLVSFGAEKPQSWINDRVACVLRS
jgi:hypothetical protein